MRDRAASPFSTSSPSASQTEPFNAVATGDLRAGDPAHVRGGAVHARSRIGIQHRHDERARADGPAPDAERRGRAAAFPRRGRGGVRPVGGRAARRHDGLRRLGRPRRTTSTTRSTTPSRCSWSSSWRWRRRGRSSASPKRRCGAWPTPGGGTPARLVGRDPDGRPAARLVHHRAGRDDDLRAAARRASSTICSRAGG